MKIMSEYLSEGIPRSIHYVVNDILWYKLLPWEGNEPVLYIINISMYVYTGEHSIDRYTPIVKFFMY